MRDFVAGLVAGLIGVALIVYVPMGGIIVTIALFVAASYGRTS